MPKSYMLYSKNAPSKLELRLDPSACSTYEYNYINVAVHAYTKNMNTKDSSIQVNRCVSSGCILNLR